jgi:bifunctional non-homologous end joining protein LigD
MLPAIVYQVFDLLWLDGEDLRPLDYLDRKALLKKLLRRSGDTIRCVDYIEGDGGAMLKAACKMDMEGIVSKRLDSPYRGGPSGRRRSARSARRSL